MFVFFYFYQYLDGGGNNTEAVLQDKSTANVRNVKPSFLGGNMTKCEFYQNKIELCIQAMNRTTGFMRAVWYTHAERLRIKMNSLSLKELRENYDRNGKNNVD
jgi:hypothetical protein